MTDLISRQAAIEAATYGNPQTAWQRIKALPSAQPDLDKWCTDCSEYDSEKHCCPRWNKVIRQTVDDLKDVQPEWQTGEWIFKITNGEPFFVCSKCGRVVWDDEEVITFDYCPGCGALMSESLKMARIGEALVRGVKEGVIE